LAVNSTTRLSAEVARGASIVFVRSLRRRGWGTVLLAERLPVAALLGRVQAFELLGGLLAQTRIGVLLGEQLVIFAGRDDFAETLVSLGGTHQRLLVQRRLVG